MSTNYKGINYAGPGSTVNMDADKGIRYGVISRNSVIESGQEIYEDGTNLSHQHFFSEVRENLRRALDDYFSDHHYRDGEPSDLDKAAGDALDAIEDRLNDRYQEDNDSYRYEKDDYIIETCLDNDFTVIKSPYFTYAQFCSPCVPGACNLDSPLDHIPEDGSNACYCLGHEWFEDGRAPYPVFNMGGAEIHPEGGGEQS
jgi:hypothetical protein